MKINRYERYDSRGRTLLRNEMGLGRERERESSAEGRHSD